MLGFVFVLIIDAVVLYLLVKIFGSQKKIIKEQEAAFSKLQEEYWDVERFTDLCLKAIEERDAEIKNLETIIQRYKEKLRGENEQTKS